MVGALLPGRAAVGAPLPRHARGRPTVENRSHADWRVVPSARPAAVQLAPSGRALRTYCVRTCSAWLFARATRGRLPKTASSPASACRGAMRETGAVGSGAGLLAMSWLDSATHSSQMYTPGPNARARTAVYGFRQDEHAAAAPVVVMAPPLLPGDT